MYIISFLQVIFFFLLKIRCSCPQLVVTCKPPSLTKEASIQYPIEGEITYNTCVTHPSYERLRAQNIALELLYNLYNRSLCSSFLVQVPFHLDGSLIYRQLSKEKDYIIQLQLFHIFGVVSSILPFNITMGLY